MKKFKVTVDLLDINIDVTCEDADRIFDLLHETDRFFKLDVGDKICYEFGDVINGHHKFDVNITEFVDHDVENVVVLKHGSETLQALKENYSRIVPILTDKKEHKEHKILLEQYLDEIKSHGEMS